MMLPRIASSVRWRAAGPMFLGQLTGPSRRFRPDLPGAYTGRQPHDSAQRPQSATQSTSLRLPQDVITSPQRLECRAPRIASLSPELLLDAQELVVFGGAVRARQRAGLDLPAIGGNREIRNGGILGL